MSKTQITRDFTVTLLILSYIMSCSFCSFSLVAVHAGSQMAACRSCQSRTLTVEWVLREWYQSCRAKCPTTIQICLLHSSCQFIRYCWSIRWLQPNNAVLPKLFSNQKFSLCDLNWINAKNFSV